MDYDTIVEEELRDEDCPPPSTMLTEEQLSKMSGGELIDLCKKRNVAIRGTNADKIKRLLLGKKRRKVPSDQERKANQREWKAKSRAKKKEAEILQRQKDEEESNKNLTQFSRKVAPKEDLYMTYETSPEKLPRWLWEVMRQDILRRAQKEAEAARKVTWRADPKNRARENALSAARMRKKRAEEQAAYESRQLKLTAKKRVETEKNHQAELPPDLLSSGCGGSGRGNRMSGCGCLQPTQKKIFEITGPGGHPVHASAAIEPSMSHFLMVCPLRRNRMPQQMCYLERDQPHDPLLFDVALKNHSTTGRIPGWQVRINASSGRLYYYNYRSGITQWERPTSKSAEDGVDSTPAGGGSEVVDAESTTAKEGIQGDAKEGEEMSTGSESSPARTSKKVTPSLVSDLLKDTDTVEIRINGISVCRLLRDCTHARATIRQTSWGDRSWRKRKPRGGIWKWERSLIITHYYHFLHGETVWGWEEKFCIEVFFRALSDDLISGAEEIIAKWDEREHWDGHHLYKFLEENGVTEHNYWTGMYFDRIVFQQFAWKKGKNNTLWKAVSKELRERNDSDRSARYGNDWGFCSWKCYADFKRKGKKFKSQNPHVSVPDIFNARTSADCKWCQKCLSEFKKFGRKAGDAVPGQLCAVEAGRMPFGKKEAGECNEQSVPDEQLSALLLMDGSHDEDGTTAEI